MIEGITLQQIIEILVVIGTITGAYAIFKRQLHNFREFIDAIDDANFDDKVTQEEFNRIFSKWLSFLAGFGTKPVKKV